MSDFNDVCRQAYATNKHTFGRRGLRKAHIAYSLYMENVYGASMVAALSLQMLSEEDAVLTGVIDEHKQTVKELKARIKQFKKLTALLAWFGDRPALECCEPTADEPDAALLVYRVQPEALAAHWQFEHALDQYISEIKKRHVDDVKAIQLLRHIGYLYNSSAWSLTDDESSAPAPLASFGTHQYLEAILKLPTPSKSASDKR